MAPLPPLLTKHGLQTTPLPAGNLALSAFKGLIVKDSYWRWPEQNKAGNAIDFLVQVLGLSFNEAMHQIIGTLQS